MNIVCASHESTTSLAKRILFLAYEASGVMGMGAFQERDAITEEQVWNNVVTKGDYGGFSHDSENLYADYVFGRMMKTRFTLKDNTITYNGDDKPRVGYQSWGSKYKSHTKLFQAALKSLGMTEQVNP